MIAGNRGRWPRLRVGALVAIIAFVGHSPAWAQIPGSELGDGSRARSEYLASTYSEVKLILDDWRDAFQKGDLKRLRQMFTDDGLYSPAEGWYVQGREPVIDSLTARAGRLKGYHSSLLDFTASGGLAYYLGRVSYLLDLPGASRQVNGTFVMVLYQGGRRWKVRSYIERESIN